MRCDHSAQLGCGLDTQPAGSRQNELIIFTPKDVENPCDYFDVQRILTLSMNTYTRLSEIKFSPLSAGPVV